MEGAAGYVGGARRSIGSGAGRAHHEGKAGMAGWLARHPAVSVEAPSAEAGTKARPVALPPPPIPAATSVHGSRGRVEDGGAFSDRRVRVGGSAAHPVGRQAISFASMFE